MMDREVFTCMRSHVATAAYDEDKNKQEASYQCEISCGTWGTWTQCSWLHTAGTGRTSLPCGSVGGASVAGMLGMWQGTECMHMAAHLHKEFWKAVGVVRWEITPIPLWHSHEFEMWHYRIADIRRYYLKKNLNALYQATQVIQKYCTCSVSL